MMISVSPPGRTSPTAAPSSDALTGRHQLGDRRLHRRLHNLYDPQISVSTRRWDATGPARGCHPPWSCPGRPLEHGGRRFDYYAMIKQIISIPRLSRALSRPWLSLADGIPIQSAASVSARMVAWV